MCFQNVFIPRFEVSDMVKGSRGSLGFELSLDQFHGLSGYANTTSNVILGFEISHDQSQGLSGYANMTSKVVVGFELSHC
jgi:hypothetical protein